MIHWCLLDFLEVSEGQYLTIFYRLIYYNLVFFLLKSGKSKNTNLQFNYICIHFVNKIKTKNLHRLQTNSIKFPNFLTARTCLPFCILFFFRVYSVFHSENLCSIAHLVPCWLLDIAPCPLCHISAFPRWLFAAAYYESSLTMCAQYVVLRQTPLAKEKKRTNRKNSLNFGVGEIKQKRRRNPTEKLAVCRAIKAQVAIKKTNGKN